MLSKSMIPNAPRQLVYYMQAEFLTLHPAVYSAVYMETTGIFSFLTLLGILHAGISPRAALDKKTVRMEGRNRN